MHAIVAISMTERAFQTSSIPTLSLCLSLSCAAARAWRLRLLRWELRLVQTPVLIF